MSHRGLVVVLLSGLAACGEAKVANVSYAEIREAAAAGDEASFREYSGICAGGASPGAGASSR